MTQTTIRDRFRDYEFTDEQEMTLTLELLTRIEKDIAELKTAKTRDGFNSYLVIGSIGAILFVLLGELGKLNQIAFSKIGIVFFALILVLKIPWAIYQLVAIDLVSQKKHIPGRFFWSNDFFFELRPAGVFQLFVFLLSFVLMLFVHLPLWITVVTGISFTLYIFILGLIFVISFRKEPYRPDSANKKTLVGLPILFLAFTMISVVGLIFRMEIPLGNETQPYVIAGLLIAIVVFIDMQIRLATPSPLLEKLTKLRNDIIFLRTNLEDAWTRYDVCIDGHDLSEELRGDMDDIIQCFNTLDFHQTKKVEALSAIQLGIKKLQIQGDLPENCLDALNNHRIQFFSHNDDMNRVYEYLNPRLESLKTQIHRIGRATQEWKRTDEYHQYILSRFARLIKQDEQIAQDGKETDVQIQKLQPKLDPTSGDNNSSQGELLPVETTSEKGSQK